MQALREKMRGGRSQRSDVSVHFHEIRNTGEVRVIGHRQAGRTGREEKMAKASRWTAEERWQIVKEALSQKKLRTDRQAPPSRLRGSPHGHCDKESSFVVQAEFTL